MLNGRPSRLPQSDPSGAGAAWVETDVLIAPFNDLAATERIIGEHAHELAGVIVEPFHRCLVPAPGFLAGVRAVTQRHGVVLIFDEVVTGFRFALGGAQEYYGVIPDLVAYGKALGGGFPLGAYVGRAALMEVVNEHRLPGPAYVWSASTTGGNPVSCAAALATLEVLSQPGVYPSLRAAGARLRRSMSVALASCGETAQVLGDGPIAQVAFSASPVTDQQSWLASDRKRGRAIMLELLRSGVFLNPMGTKLYLSLAHDDAGIDEFVERFTQALRKTVT
jgi:glutamate-1-semialdehyde 2,1-aminomutase